METEACKEHIIHFHNGNSCRDDGGYFSFSYDLEVGNGESIHLIEEFIGAEKIPLMLMKFFWNRGFMPGLCTIWQGRGHPRDWDTKRFKSQIDICGVRKTKVKWLRSN